MHVSSSQSNTATQTDDKTHVGLHSIGLHRSSL